MPNTFAYLAIGTWPLVIAFFINRYGFNKAVLFSYLFGYMFLPASFAIEMKGLPNLDKFTITSITLLTYMIFKKREIGFKYMSKPMKLFLLLLLIGPIFTALTNKSPYLFIQGLTAYDGITQGVLQFLYFFPYLIGLAYFRDEGSQVILFKYLSIAAFFYAILALYEIRMSPQLHTYLYGYFPHSFSQQYRSGGFRAVIFMGHGLLVAIFLAIGLSAISTVRKAKIRISRISVNFLLLVLFITLFFSKSYAALVFAMFVFLCISFLSSKLIYSLCAAIGLIFITYPFFSSINLFPHQEIVSVAEFFNEDRASSLNFRFENEEKLLSHANEKPWFGWGGWGRNRVYDPETGIDVSVTDGTWIITLGTVGWVGYVSKFIFLILPLFLVVRNYKRFSSEQDSTLTLMAGHVLIVSIILLDQLPNSSLNSLYWLIAGSLMGRIQFLSNTPVNGVK